MVPQKRKSSHVQFQMLFLMILVTFTCFLQEVIEPVSLGNLESHGYVATHDSQLRACPLWCRLSYCLQCVTCSLSMLIPTAFLMKHLAFSRCMIYQPVTLLPPSAFSCQLIQRISCASLLLGHHQIRPFFQWLTLQLKLLFPENKFLVTVLPLPDDCVFLMVNSFVFRQSVLVPSLFFVQKPTWVLTEPN